MEEFGEGEDEVEEVGDEVGGDYDELGNIVGEIIKRPYQGPGGRSQVASANLHHVVTEGEFGDEGPQLLAIDRSG